MKHQRITQALGSALFLFGLPAAAARAPAPTLEGLAMACAAGTCTATATISTSTPLQNVVVDSFFSVGQENLGREGYRRFNIERLEPAERAPVSFSFTVDEQLQCRLMQGVEARIQVRAGGQRIKRASATATAPFERNPLAAVEGACSPADVFLVEPEAPGATTAGDSVRVAGVVGNVSWREASAQVALEAILLPLPGERGVRLGACPARAERLRFPRAREIRCSVDIPPTVTPGHRQLLLRARTNLDGATSNNVATLAIDILEAKPPSAQPWASVEVQSTDDGLLVEVANLGPASLTARVTATALPSGELVASMRATPAWGRPVRFHVGVPTDAEQVHVVAACVDDGRCANRDDVVVDVGRFDVDTEPPPTFAGLIPGARTCLVGADGVPLTCDGDDATRVTIATAAAGALAAGGATTFALPTLDALLAMLAAPLAIAGGIAVAVVVTDRIVWTAAQRLEVSHTTEWAARERAVRRAAGDRPRPPPRPPCDPRQLEQLPRAVRALLDDALVHDVTTVPRHMDAQCGGRVIETKNGKASRSRRIVTEAIRDWCDAARGGPQRIWTNTWSTKSGIGFSGPLKELLVDLGIATVDLAVRGDEIAEGDARRLRDRCGDR